MPKGWCGPTPPPPHPPFSTIFIICQNDYQGCCQDFGLDGGGAIFSHKEGKFFCRPPNQIPPPKFKIIYFLLGKSNLMIKKVCKSCFHKRYYYATFSWISSLLAKICILFKSSLIKYALPQRIWTFKAFYYDGFSRRRHRIFPGGGGLSNGVQHALVGRLWKKLV